MCNANAKPFLLCTKYHPPNSQTESIDLFEEELSAAQATGLEIDLNIVYLACANKKWLDLVKLFDLSQLVLEPSRITLSVSTIIDHVYTADPENIGCFTSNLSISDQYPVCFTRKVNCKIPKSNHITAS